MYEIKTALELPIIVMTVKGKDNTNKDLIVRRQKVCMALQWLVEHNSVYKNIKTDLIVYLPFQLKEFSVTLKKSPVRWTVRMK